MHCPGCGKQTSMEQKFCRACGMNLETIAIAMGAQGYTSVQDEARLAAGRRMMRWMSWGVIITFAGMFLGIAGKKLIHDDFISGIGALIAVAGIFLICIGSLATLAPRRKSRQATTEPTPAKPTLPLELPPESIRSVTESTTKLLEVEKVEASVRPRD